MKYISCPRLQVPSHPGPAAAWSFEVRVAQPGPLSPHWQWLTSQAHWQPGTAVRPARSARVTPGLSSQSWFTRVIWAGLETRHSIRGGTIQGGLIKLTPGSGRRRPVIGVTWPLYFEETKYG